MNRAERRAMGYRGPAYFQATGDPRPRYVRRNMAAVIDAPADTRKYRKRKARILRSLRRMYA